MSATTDISEKHANLAVFNASSGAAKLACDADRWCAFLEKAGFIKYDDRRVVTEVVAYITVQGIT